MELQFLGAAGIVTGSCHKLTVNSKSLLLDCGMYQGTKDTTKLNFKEFKFNPRNISAIVLSHAHIDHSGLIPKLYKEGFRGKIFCTKATKELCRIMLEDSADIQERETLYDNKRLAREGLPLRKPLYNKKDALQCMKLFKGIDYGIEFEPIRGVSAVFRDAGHILGSAITKLECKEGKYIKSVVFSGDLGKPDTPIIKDPEFIRDADVVIMESTYGSRIHEDIKERKQMLLRIIRETYEKEGILMIPTFAIERAQEIIYTLNEFVEKGLMPDEKVFLDSPLATKATEVFMKHSECYDRKTRETIDSGDKPFEFPGLKYITAVNESKKLNDIKEPFVIIAGSGMCNGGRIKHHLKNHLDEEKSTVLFVGYQAAGTLGRSIREGAKRARIYGKWYDIKVNIESIGGFSAHADKPVLSAWASNFAGEPLIYLVHGEPSESSSLAEEIRRFNPNVRIAKMGQTVKLC